MSSSGPSVISTNETAFAIDGPIGRNGSLNRADSIEEDGGLSFFNVNTIGIDDALPDSMMSGSTVMITTSTPRVGRSLLGGCGNKELMTAYWSDYLDTSTSINDASGFVSLRKPIRTPAFPGNH